MEQRIQTLHAGIVISQDMVEIIALRIRQQLEVEGRRQGTEEEESQIS